MVEACRLEVSTGERRNPSRDAARAIQCRAGERRTDRTALALANDEIPDHWCARQYHLCTRLLTYPPIPETYSDGRRLSQRAAGTKDSVSQ